MQRIRETVDVTKEVLEESEKAAAAASAKKANADQQQQQIDSAHKEAANKSVYNWDSPFPPCCCLTMRPAGWQASPVNEQNGLYRCISVIQLHYNHVLWRFDL